MSEDIKGLVHTLSQGTGKMSKIKTEAIRIDSEARASVRLIPNNITSQQHKFSRTSGANNCAEPGEARATLAFPHA